MIRLKKGKYLIAGNLKDDPPSLELIANQLYGPSYVSFESALSSQGWIPERTYTIKSAVSKRKKQFKTPYGSFEYLTVPDQYYAIGIQQQKLFDRYFFLIATPEKALCDLIITTKGLRIQSAKAMHRYLEEDLRIESEVFSSANTEIIRQAGEFGYKKQELSLLHRLIESYKGLTFLNRRIK